MAPPYFATLLLMIMFFISDGMKLQRIAPPSSVATLLFMLMLPGKTPYAQKGGEDPITNIKNMDFSYPCGDKSNKKTPDGPWGYCWSHLPYKLKEAFYETFQKG